MTGFVIRVVVQQRALQYLINIVGNVSIFCIEHFCLWAQEFYNVQWLISTLKRLKVIYYLCTLYIIAVNEWKYWEYVIVVP